MLDTKARLTKAYEDGVDPIAIMLVVEILRTLDSSIDFHDLTSDIPLDYLRGVLNGS